MLILAGATNATEVLESAKHDDVERMLQKVKALLENDEKNLVSAENIAGGELEVEFLVKLAIKWKKPRRIIHMLMSTPNINPDIGHIGWSNLNLAKSDIEWIQYLPQKKPIKQLILSQNHLSVLPISIANHLRECTKLDLCQNNITDVPSSVLELPLIKELNLSSNEISVLPDVCWSASLNKLNLSKNKLKTLPDCATELCADFMKVLQLGHNQFEKVPKCVCLLHSLITLDISYNKLSFLPADISQFKELKKLILCGLHLNDPPQHICNKSLKSCMSYLKAEYLKRSKCYHMKLLLVGNSSVGKTTLVGCLNKDKHYLDGPIIGINISEWPYCPNYLYNRSTYTFNVWDFAGQEDYYAIHQVFMSKRSLYLVVWNVLEGEDGIVGLKPWLDNIILQAPGSQIIVVATHLDKLIAELGNHQAEAQCEEYATCLRDFKNVEVALFVALKGKLKNVTELQKEIYKVAENFMIDSYPIVGQAIPSIYKKVYQKLQKLSVPILHSREFTKMVRDLSELDIQSDNEIRALTLLLHDTGSLLHFDVHRHNLDDLYFVKPQWLCKLMYTVVTVKERNGYVKDGRISKLKFKEFFEGTSYNSQLPFELYLELLSRFEIVLPLDKEGDQLLIPFFLPSDRPEVRDVLSTQNHYQRQFRFQNATIPPGLWSKLLLRIMNTIKVVRDLLDKNRGELLYWKNGLYFHSCSTWFIIKSSQLENKVNGITIIYSGSAAKEGLLCQLVNSVQEIVSEWFPGLVEQLEELFICYECAMINHHSSYELERLQNCIADSKPLHCEFCKHYLDLKILAPDHLLSDIDQNLLMKRESIQIQHLLKLECNHIQRNKNIIWSGRFGKVYHATLISNTSVVVKFYDNNKNKDKSIKRYKSQVRIFRADLTYMQRIKHPCLVSMIGVCKYPNFALVMETCPMGSLDSCLLKELRKVPRIVVYRIAAQIASALCFLHSNSIMYCNLTTTKVLVWSLSLDDLVNCKLEDLEIATYENKKNAEGSFSDKFIAPEVNKQAIYDQRVDIYSFGMVLKRIMERSYPTDQLMSEWDIINFSSESEFHHIKTLTRRCCNNNPTDRPDLQEIVEQLSYPVNQLVMNVTTFNGNISCACTGCIHAETSATTCHTDCFTEAWVSFQHGDSSEIIALSFEGLKPKAGKRVIVKDHHIYTMLSHKECVWATSVQTEGTGSLLKFAGSRDAEYIVVPIRSKVTEDDNSLPDGDYGVSLACSDNYVYVGTISGWCLMFPTDVDNNTEPIRKIRMSSNFICSMIVVKEVSLLWVSITLYAGDQILFVNLSDLEFDQDRKGVNIDDYRSGKLLLSPDERIVWTVHVNGHSISAWNAQQRQLICHFNSHKLLDEKTDQKNSRIASMSVVLDALWVGLISGHILAVTAKLPQRVLITMKPYNHAVQVLVPIYEKNRDNTVIISIGKDYVFKEQSMAKKQESVDIVIWEVVSAKYMLQMKYLAAGNAWVNNTSLNKVGNSLQCIASFYKDYYM